MKNEEVKELLPLNLQFFASEEGAEENSEEENEEGSKDEGAEGSKKKQEPLGKVFTQEQINKMMAKEKNQGRAAVLKELGIDPKDTKMTAMVKALIESQKTPEDKKAESDVRVKELESKAFLAEAKAEVLMSGVKKEFVEDAVTLAVSKMSDGTTTLSDVLESFKTKYPVWFAESEDDDEKGKSKEKPTGQKGTGSSMKGSEKAKATDLKGMGARLAAESKKQATVKQSLWGNN